MIKRSVGLTNVYAMFTFALDRISLVIVFYSRFIYEPLGKSLNIPNRRPEPPKPNAQLETAFQASRHPSDAQILVSIDIPFSESCLVL